MPRSNGIYTLPPDTAAVSGEVIASDDYNTVNADMAQALTDSVVADGTKPMAANLPMGGNKLTGLAAGSANGDSVRYEQAVLRAGSTMTGELILPDIGPTSDRSGGFRCSPQNFKDATSYTLVLADAGKTIRHADSSAHTFTIPPNSSVAFPLGTIIGFVNVGSGALTIARGSGVTMRWAGTGSNANRSLGEWGWASIYKVSTDIWMISGAGLT